MDKIVKALNNFISSNYGITGKFSQYKTYRVSPNFKSFRTYELNLVYINNGKSYPIIVEEVTVKETDDKDPTNELNSKFLEFVFDYVASDEFRDLVNGKLNI